MDPFKILLIIISFFMMVTSSIAVSKISKDEDKNLKNYYYFSVALSLLGLLFGVGSMAMSMQSSKPPTNLNKMVSAAAGGTAPPPNAFKFK
jgi:uncharacterized membrane protein